MVRCTFCDYKNQPGATRCVGCGAEVQGSLDAGHESLTDKLTSLVRTGRKAEAIHVYRERTGAGLQEAEDAVKALERGKPLPSVEGPLTTVSQDVVSLLREGKKIAAIKLYREKTGVGLLEAKQAVDTLANEYGLAGQGRGCMGMLLSALLFVWFVVYVIA